MSVKSFPTTLRSFYTPRSPRAGDLTTRVRMAVRSNVLSFAPILINLQRDCATPLPVLRHVADAMAADMRAGLAVDGGSDLKMILSYVDSLPTGNEKGLFYALDLGGTNFRVLRVQLGGKDERVVATEFDQVSIPQELMFGTSGALFDFIASGLAKFAEKEGGKFHLPYGRTRETGFTFSFPVKQTSIDSGILIKWTKGFAVSGTAGKDVVSCLNEAMERQGLNMRVSALVNDTVGTLAGARYWDDDVMVAVILGTGTNACYVEQVDSIPKLKAQKFTSGRTIVNTEWGAFSNGLPLTEFDRQMDAESINPGEQIFEKTISGMYLGEIVRRVLVNMAEAADLFGERVPEKLSTPFILGTPHISAMQQDSSKDLEAVGSILYDVAGADSNVNARKIVLEVCDTIARDNSIPQFPDRALHAPRRIPALRNTDEELQVSSTMPVQASRIRRLSNSDVLDPSMSIDVAPIMRRVTSDAGKPLTELSGEQPLTVSILLHFLGLGKYAINFLAEEVDMTALKQMQGHDLKAMGLPMGPRKKILLAIAPSPKRQR